MSSTVRVQICTKRLRLSYNGLHRTASELSSTHAAHMHLSCFCVGFYPQLSALHDLLFAHACRFAHVVEAAPRGFRYGIVLLRAKVGDARMG